jgi:hypothetical protein
MGAARSSETLIAYYNSVWHHNTEELEMKALYSLLIHTKVLYLL